MAARNCTPRAFGLSWCRLSAHVHLLLRLESWFTYLHQALHHLHFLHCRTSSHLDVVDLFSPVNIEWHRAHPKAGLLAQFFLEIHGLLGGRQRSGRLGSPCLVLPLGTCYIQSIEGVALLSRSRRPRDLYAVFCCFSSSPDHSPNECRQAAPACQPIGMSVEAGHVARISVLPICPCQLECVPACESSSQGLHFDVYAQAV